MFTCQDHTYAVVLERWMLFTRVYVICTNSHCEYEQYLGRRLRWRDS